MDTSKNITITREFDAPKEAVWKAWTDAEMLKQWWGPEGFTAPEIQIDLREGGKFNYCMHGQPSPDMPAMDMWSGGEFIEIVPLEKIVYLDYFTDKDGNFVDPVTYGIGEHFPKKNKAVATFEEVDGKTKLSISSIAQNEEEYEALKKSGMEEGWASSLNKLDAALKQ